MAIGLSPVKSLGLKILIRGYAIHSFAQLFAIAQRFAVAVGVEKPLQSLRHEGEIIHGPFVSVPVQPFQIVTSSGAVFRRRRPTSARAHRDGALGIPGQNLLQPNIQRPARREVVFVPEPLAVMQTEPRKRDLPRILVEGNAATQRRSIVPSMDAKAVEMFPAPVEGQLENFMELGNAGSAAHQEAPPNQGTDVPKRYSKLIKVCHLRSLQDPTRKRHNLSPRNLPLSQSEEWKHGGGECAAILQRADEATSSADEDTRADFEECRAYWEQEFPNLSDRTRSIITLSFSMLVRPFITRPLRKLFSTDTNVMPEDTFKGKIIIVDLPVQEFFLAGRVANLAWKYCFQRAVLSRPQPTDGSFLRPVFLWADECQNFVTEFDAAYQAVARSAGGCTVYLVQNRESLLRVLHSPSAVDSLLGNLQCKCSCQNSSIETNDWAAKLLGERYRDIISTSGTVSSVPGQDGGQSSGASTREQRRYFVEPARFTTLKRGGPVHDYQVECIVYNGSMKFDGREEHGPPEKQPYTQISFDQLTKEQRAALR